MEYSSSHLGSFVNTEKPIPQLYRIDLGFCSTLKNKKLKILQRVPCAEEQLDTIYPIR